MKYELEGGKGVKNLTEFLVCVVRKYRGFATKTNVTRVIIAKKWQNMKVAGDVLRIVTVGRQEAGSSVYFAQQVREQCKLGVQNNLRRT